MAHEIPEEKLTAYALGEVTDEAERARIEAHIAENPDAAAHVDRTRSLGRDLAEAMAHASEGTLTDEQRAAIEREKTRRERTVLFRFPKTLAAAAAILVLGSVATAVYLFALGVGSSGVKLASTTSPAPEGSSPGPDADSASGAAATEANGPATTSSGSASSQATSGGGAESSSTDAAGSAEETRPTAKARPSRSADRRKSAAESAASPRATSAPSSGSAKQTGAPPRVAKKKTAPRPRVPSEAKRAEEAAVRRGPRRGGRELNTEQYARIRDNPFYRADERPLSTFSVDVDTASYANVRRFLLREHRLPPKDAVRIEEMINYFDYGYEPPSTPPGKGGDPFAAHMAVAGCPWKAHHRLVRIGLKGWEPPTGQRKPANLVFLLDVSGSMKRPNKLPLLKQAFKKLVEQLRPNDRVTIVVYAGASGLVLEPTPATKKRKILDALTRLQAGGSTNGGEGIKLAYRKAEEAYLEEGINRVILATDGDFNVGVTSRGALTRLIEKKAKSGVYLSVLGFGTGNVKDDRMEQLSNKGNGNYSYIDSAREAEKVLVDQVAGTLRTIAKDVKLQVEFNPAEVRSYRLIGYANRILDKEDFSDDTKDAGDIGAGHTVTALYEVVPAEAPTGDPAKKKALRKRVREVRATLESADLTDEARRKYEAELKKLQAKLAELERPAGRSVDALKYQKTKKLAKAAKSGELLTVKIRYKEPDEKKKQGTSELLKFPVEDSGTPFREASKDFRFAASVAAFGMLLRDSEHKGSATYEDVRKWASGSVGEDPHGYRSEFLRMVKEAKALAEEGSR